MLPYKNDGRIKSRINIITNLCNMSIMCSNVCLSGNDWVIDGAPNGSSKIPTKLHILIKYYLLICKLNSCRKLKGSPPLLDARTFPSGSSMCVFLSYQSINKKQDANHFFFPNHVWNFKEERPFIINLPSFLDPSSWFSFFSTWTSKWD